MHGEQTNTLRKRMNDKSQGSSRQIAHCTLEPYLKQQEHIVGPAGCSDAQLPTKTNHTEWGEKLAQPSQLNGTCWSFMIVYPHQASFTSSDCHKATSPMVPRCSSRHVHADTDALGT